MIENEVFDVNGYKMAIAKDDVYFYSTFNNGKYWDWDTLTTLKSRWIDPSKNIVEIGAHCGTSTCFYSRATNKRVIAFEPQKSMFDLLEKNICQNDLKNVDLRKQAVFYKNDNVFMDDIETHRTSATDFNRGGLSLGTCGEATMCSILNDLDIDDCGFLHIDAQGAEQHIIYSGLEFIKKHKPIILWENNLEYDTGLVNAVNSDLSIPQEVKDFDIEKALTDLGYTNCDKWSGIDTLSVPTKKMDSLENSVAIVGLCKNVDEWLNDYTLPLIEAVAKSFSKSYLYIYTNDNTDNTLETLQKYKEKTSLYEDFTIEAEEGIVSMNRQDLTILVYGRNKCLNYARSKKTKYMVVLDLDNVCTYECSSLFIKEMKHQLDKDNVVCVSKAISRNNFYDKYSYRTKRFPSCMYLSSDHTAIWAEVLPDKINKVISYFGGLCIYKMALCPADACYDRKDSKGANCCEHVAFNEKLEGEHYIYCYNDKI